MRARAFARRNIKELFRDPLALFFGLGFPLSVPAHRLPHDGGGLPAGLPSAHAPHGGGAERHLHGGGGAGAGGGAVPLENGGALSLIPLVSKVWRIFFPQFAAAIPQGPP